MANEKETGSYVPRIRIEKFEAGSVKPFEVVEREGNLTTDAGKEYLAGLLTGTGQVFHEDHVRVCVGTGSDPAASTDTVVDVGAANASNRHLQLPDSVSAFGSTVTIVATFDTDVANFAWESWGLDVTDDDSAVSGIDAGDRLFNRKVESLGTKNSSQTWVFTVTLDF